MEGQIAELADRGVRCLGVACTNNDIGGWVFMGVLTFTDPLRADCRVVLDRVQRLGVRVKIFTGDHKAVAADTCRTLGLQGQVLGSEGLADMTAAELAESTSLGVEYGPLLGSAVAFAQV